MQGNSRKIHSSQVALHDKLATVVDRHQQNDYLKPLSEHTVQAFADFQKTVDEVRRPLILDSGCGGGESTIFLGSQYPESWIVGIDKSQVRMSKALKKERPDNVLYQRADQFDFWRLARLHRVQFEHHFIFYPNPWPKKEHLQRRIHGHPAFSDLVWISKTIRIRSNWRLYLEEFAAAYELATRCRGNVQQVHVKDPITLFEDKFSTSGHDIYEFTN
jgi:tRNA (guanine-N7-)-methyltransferase